MSKQGVAQLFKRTLKKVGLKESEIQRQIIDWLELKENQGKLFFQRTNNIPVSQMRNGKRIFRSMAKGQKKDFPIF